MGWVIPVLRKEIDQRQVIAAFDNKRRTLTRSAVIIVAVVVGLGIQAYQGGLTKPMAAVFFAVSFVWGLIVNVKIWRCPACNGHLGKLYLGLKFPKYCPNCGVMLMNE